MKHGGKDSFGYPGYREAKLLLHMVLLFKKMLWENSVLFSQGCNNRNWYYIPSAKGKGSLSCSHQHLCRVSDGNCPSRCEVLAPSGFGWIFLAHQRRERRGTRTWDGRQSSFEQSALYFCTVCILAAPVAFTFGFLQQAHAWTSWPVFHVLVPVSSPNISSFPALKTLFCVCFGMGDGQRRSSHHKCNVISSQTTSQLP